VSNQKRFLKIWQLPQSYPGGNKNDEGAPQENFSIWPRFLDFLFLPSLFRLCFHLPFLAQEGKKSSRPETLGPQRPPPTAQQGNVVIIHRANRDVPTFTQTPLRRGKTTNVVIKSAFKYRAHWQTRCPTRTDNSSEFENGQPPLLRFNKKGDHFRGGKAVIKDQSLPKPRRPSGTTVFNYEKDARRPEFPRKETAEHDFANENERRNKQKLGKPSPCPLEHSKTPQNGSKNAWQHLEAVRARPHPNFALPGAPTPYMSSPWALAPSPGARRCRRIRLILISLQLLCLKWSGTSKSGGLPLFLENTTESCPYDHRRCPTCDSADVSKIVSRS